MVTLSPFVLWAQTKKCLFLKVDLKDVQEPRINLEERELRFESKGVGARGLNDYSFTLNFFNDIDVKESVHKISDNRVDFTIAKTEHKWWPRLICETQKPIWLKIDHDRFQSEDMDEDIADIRTDYPTLYDKLQKEELGYKKEDFRKVYLTFYNLFMYIGFLYVISVLSIRYLKEGPDCFAGTYEAVGHTVLFLELIQGLEILHPVFGYVKGGAFVPFIQVGGRWLIMILMLEYEPRLQTMPVVFYLFSVWSFIEIIRYPYYISQILERQNGLLTWLRYTAWMVCYPIGFVCETVIVFRNMIFMEQSGKWSVELTTPYEITLRFSTLLKIHLLFVVLPSCYTLLSHMYKARQQRIGPKTAKKGKKTK